ncbi:adhesion G protein-coupled receptor B2 [Trichonephila clavipes]|nr:adhesion G protein-coupled receptor B2 [Trichonephila clavipes]
MEEEAEKYYIIRGLKENRAIEIQLQSCSNIEELKEKMKLLDIQEKSKSSKNEVIYPKYPMTRIPYHTNQFAHRQQYGGRNWRNDQSQHPDTITNTRYKVYSPQFPSPYHHPSFSRQWPTLYPRNQQFPQRPSILRPNAPTFYPRQRTQINNTVFQPHQTRELMIIQGRINFKQVDVLLDTGSRESVNIIPKNIISQIKGYHNVEYIKTKIATINGEIEMVVGHDLFSAGKSSFVFKYYENTSSFIGRKKDNLVALHFKYDFWHMTATAGSDVIQSGRPMFDDFFQHLWPYIGNNMANAVFQMVKRLWLIRIDQGLNTASQKIV